MNSSVVFFWTLQGDPAELRARLKAASVRSLAVKCGDHGSWWSQYTTLAPHLDAAHIERPAWQYCWPSTAAADAQIAAAAKSAGAPYVVLDMEKEYVGQPQAASLFGRLLRAKLGDAYPIYVTTYSSPLAQPDFPWREVAAWADGIIPQVYAGAYPGGSSTQELMSAWDSLVALGRPIMPGGSIYGKSTCQDVMALMRLAAAHQCSAVYWWDYDSAEPTLLARVASANLVEMRKGV